MPRPQPYRRTTGPFRSMRWNQLADHQDGDYYYAHGCYAIAGRLQRQFAGEFRVASSTFSDTPQGLFSFERPSAAMLVAVVAGQLYTTTSGVWSLSVTQANFATAGITFSTTATVYGCQF